MVVIIDYGICNVGSIENMLNKIGINCVLVTNDPDRIKTADHLILPGVGSFDSGMASLEEFGLVESIREFAKRGKAILGICLGMQLLGRKSEEGSSCGLDLIPMECRRFHFEHALGGEFGMGLKIPHMGWDRVTLCRDSKLLDEIVSPQRYYFVHSYHAVVYDSFYELMSCDYGYRFPAAVQCENVYGCQFHPEKSHSFGMHLLSNFIRKC